jgi:hypothetical protein
MATDGFPFSGDTITQTAWHKLIEAHSPIGFVVSGMTVTDGTGNTVDVAAGAVVVDGAYFDVDAYAGLAVTASATRYVYLTRTDDTLDYNVGAALPTDPGYTLLAKVVTDGSGNSTITDFRKRTPFHKGATVVVAASDASPWSKAGADFICDGTADHKEINAAIELLAAWGVAGTVELTEGTFVGDTDTAAGSGIVANVAGLTLRGQGMGVTVLDWSAATSADYVIGISASSVTVKDLSIETNAAGYIVAGVYCGAAVAETTVDSVEVDNNSALAYGIYFTSAPSSYRITGCHLHHGKQGISVEGAHCRIEGNRVTHQTWYGINLGSGLDRGTVMGNSLLHGGTDAGSALIVVQGDNVTVVGNTGYSGNTDDAILLAALSTNCCVVGNQMTSSGGITDAGTGNTVASNEL